MACDLREVELFKDEGGELITSLVLEDKPRPPVELERIEEAGNKTENHAALWGCIRSRTQRGDKCTIPLLRDDMKKLGYQGDPNVWLNAFKIPPRRLVKINTASLSGE